MDAMKLYKIGELAKLCNVSSRTIDFYTRMGLIQPEKRTGKNYRLYSDETLARLKRIELLKKEKYTLDEIKANLDQWDKVSHDQQVSDKLTTLELHLKHVEREVKELEPLIEQLKPSQLRSLFKKLTPQSAACIEALLLLLGKGPFM